MVGKIKSNYKEFTINLRIRWKEMRHLRKEVLAIGAGEASKVSDPTLANLLRD